MKKKLIEVALPLEAINRESAREKCNPFLKGHPRNLHQWWTAKPLAACRAVLFACLVDDPSSHPERFPTEAAQDIERQRLFRLMEDLIKWENSDSERLIDAAKKEIEISVGSPGPLVFDPFCGRGSIPLEAQRLGLRSRGFDLNPIAVLITKALIEVPPKCVGRAPVNPTAKRNWQGALAWPGVRGLAEDIRYYAEWIRAAAEKRIGYLYPPVQFGGRGEDTSATVTSWLWARTVKCPNPACDADMPLVPSFFLSNKTGKKVWLEPLVDNSNRSVQFTVRASKADPPDVAAVSIGTSAVNSKGKKANATFRCLVCRVGIAKGEYIDSMADKGAIGHVPLAMVADRAGERIFVDFCDEPQMQAVREALAVQQGPGFLESLPDEPTRGTFASNAQGRFYGFRTFRDYFTARQQIALSTFCDLVKQAHEQVMLDGAEAEYADGLAIYLSFALSKTADYGNSLSTWNSTNINIRQLFSKQAITMAWNYAENNPLHGSASFSALASGIAESVSQLMPGPLGESQQLDATRSPGSSGQRVLICTDPPYYNNVSYSDLSDFFYVWLRRALGGYYPQLFSTILTPKKQELIAAPHRFDGDLDRATRFFEDGFRRAFSAMRLQQDPDYPLAVFYAFKQTDSEEDAGAPGESAVASTGWETMLEGLLSADYQITGTWPVRSERVARIVALGSNALASSIVLICRPRGSSAGVTTRKDFLATLKKELPQALRNLQKGNIAPVDLAQAAIGPGMAVFSRYNRVLETDGSPMRVRTALALINQGLDEVLSELESEFDPDTRWALAWFEQHQFDEGLYGEAEVLATAKALSISHLAEAGMVHSRAGKVRLLRREELSEAWDPSTVGRLTVWEVTQHLIRSLDQKGEKDTANLKAKIGGLADIARDLAYRLYTLCERKGWAEEAGYYNSLVVAWPSMASEAFELR